MCSCFKEALPLYIDLPEVGAKVTGGQSYSTVESIKVSPPPLSYLHEPGALWQRRICWGLLGEALHLTDGCRCYRCPGLGRLKETRYDPTTRGQKGWITGFFGGGVAGFWLRTILLLKVCPTPLPPRGVTEWFLAADPPRGGVSQEWQNVACWLSWRSRVFLLVAEQ